MLYLVAIIIGAPHIEVVPRIFNAGQLYETDTIYASFVIKNTGDEPLNIKRVRQTCLCTVLSKMKPILKPGELDTLKVKVILFGLMGDILKPVYIYTNDPENHVIKVFVKAFVLELKGLPKPIYSPDKVNLGVIPLGYIKSFTIWLKNEGDADLILSQVDTPEGIYLKTKLPVIVKRMKQKPVRFEFHSAEVDTGEFNKLVTFRTNYRKNYRYDLPVAGVVKEEGLRIFSPLFLYDDGIYWIFYLENTGYDTIFVDFYGEDVSIPPGRKERLKIVKEKVKEKLRLTIDIPINEVSR